MRNFSQFLSRVLMMVTGIFMLTSSFAIATTYTSVSNGKFNDPGIWSTDGGRTKCNCIPSTELPTYTLIDRGNVEVYHSIELPKHTIFMYMGRLTVFPSGTLMGRNAHLDVRMGTLINQGNLILTDLILFSNTVLENESELVVEPGDIMVHYRANFNTSSNISVASGDFTNFGILRVAKSTAYIGVGGLFENEGYMTAEPGLCLNLDAQFKNRNSFTLSGSGEANVFISGAVTNLGQWAKKIKWCAVGTDTGMPTMEDCTGCTPSSSSAPVRLAEKPVEQSNQDIAAKQMEMAKQASFEAYPNPFADRLHLNLSDWEDETVKLTIMDAQGKVTVSAVLSLTVGAASITIPTSELASGMYLITLTGKEHVERIKRFHR